MAKFERVVARYVYVHVQGVEYRVYFEENGSGIPLVCQHTAGGDGRQWRHLLNDEDVTSKYRIIAPDLPYHGKSLPPESVEWWKEEYKLTKSFLVDFHVQFNHELGLEKPVFVGASIGGNLAVDLALEQPGEYRAVVGMEASLARGSTATYSRIWRHPRISNTFRAATMASMMSPTSPEKYRREVTWGYMQSAPSVLMGDMHYFFVDHDLTGKATKIDTSRVSVYLLTGEYDPGTPPETTALLAQQVKGAKFKAMKGLGHFAPSENYPAFKSYLMPILDEIAASQL